MTQEPFTFDAGRTAVIVMDFQQAIVANYASDGARAVERAAAVLDAARSASIPVFYVVHRGGQFEADTPDAAIHSGLAPREGEPVITKVKPGPFSTTGLDVRLREFGRDTLVLMGVATSGCVLSAVRWAADINYQLVVVKDACDDPDAEVHRVLTEKVFPRQAAVVTAQQFADAVGARR